MWRRRLKLTAVLAVLLAGLWLYQGYQGWANLSRFNLTQPWYRRLPGSTAIESWLLGTHTMATVHGSPVAITKSTLQRDFGMDVLLVNRGQTYRLLTACFLHNSIFHIMFNLGYLYTLAPLEVGCRGAFLSTFLLSGIAGNLAFLHFGQARYALGASGGICGLIGFELVSLLRSRRTREFNLLLRSAFGMLVMGIFLPGMAVFAARHAGKLSSGNQLKNYSLAVEFNSCATWCHAGGLSAGFLIAFLVARRSGYRAPILPWPLLMGLLSLAPAGREFLSLELNLGLSVQGSGCQANESTMLETDIMTFTVLQGILKAGLHLFFCSAHCWLNGIPPGKSSVPSSVQNGRLGALCCTCAKVCLT
ncbi:unnamed protein product [Durusdinium trenchii]|uniref:Peptidase S54 rhomboid domain-containing protein n=1 Tax=Durusdinium trenchii TaxID=1381693 RepID=A0ABP0HZD0_9DINO